ncbi:hypothetical protein U3516DRAFT_838951 [Neocallimastix sp. 'constans']
MGKCDEYSNKGGKSDGNICVPHIQNKYPNIRVQDDYNLEEDDKWEIVYDTLKGNVGVNVYNNNYYDKNNLMATKFFDTNNTNVLTINFMNMARTDNIANVMDLFDSSIKEMADYVNDKLISYIEEEKEKPLYNEVIILDYPSSDIIRKIYESNYNSSSISIDGQSIYTNNNYKLLLSTLSSK